MLFKRSIATLALAAALAGPALAQSTNPDSNPACARTKATLSQAPSSGSAATTSMSDTSSDAGATGSGASSASIGTGTMDKTGVNNPCVASTTGHGTGALPNSSSP